MPGEVDLVLQLPKRCILSRKRYCFGYLISSSFLIVCIDLLSVLALVKHLACHAHCVGRDPNCGLHDPLLGLGHACAPAGAGMHLGFPPLKRFNNPSIYCSIILKVWSLNELRGEDNVHH